jgi:F-type H+-transporting ATPase subunit epsilon
MAKTMRFEIVTPDAKAYAADVEMVTFTSVNGELGILPDHVRMMTEVVPGEMVVRRDGRDVFVAVGVGLVEVTADRVSILTDMAVAADKIDEARAEEARLRAEARLKDKLADEEVASVNAALARSLAQLKVKRRHRG